MKGIFSSFGPSAALAVLLSCTPIAALGIPGTAQAPAATSAAVLTDRDVSLRKLPGNILADQKEVWLFPTTLAKGKHWWPTIGVLGVTAGLLASDPYTAPTFRTTTSFSGFNSAFSETNTAAFMAAFPAVLYGVGLLRKDSYAENTALLAGEAFADGFLLDMAFKGISGRKQPLNYTGHGPYQDSFFNGSHNPFHSGGFYSLHAMTATAIATVIARRYRHHRWVPFLAYGMAGAICFSRITTSDHFPGDVFFGGAMGFVIARYAVLPAGP
jgi:membrane-associated phospholipid phosphatase